MLFFCLSTVKASIREICSAFDQSFETQIKNLFAAGYRSIKASLVLSRIAKLECNSFPSLNVASLDEKLHAKDFNLRIFKYYIENTIPSKKKLNKKKC